VNEGTPQKPPKDARVYKQKHDTPSGNHIIVEMNVCSGRNAPSDTVADPDAELVGCMTRSRRRKLDESSGDKRAQRDYSRKWTRLDRAALEHSQDRLNKRVLEDEAVAIHACLEDYEDEAREESEFEREEQVRFGIDVEREIESERADEEIHAEIAWDAAHMHGY